jgi:hypothetical protein
MIFVAQPYYHDDPKIRQERVRLGAQYCGALLKQGQMCVSPVMLGTAILEHVDLPGDFSFWDKISFELLEKSTVIYVLMLEGWDKSRGVKAEIERARHLGKSVLFIGLNQIGAELKRSEIKLKNTV